MSYINRKTTPFSKFENLELLESYKNFPVYMGCVDTPRDEDLTEDMSWYIDKFSGFIQLNPLLPLDVVYAKEHGSGKVGKIWAEHHNKFCEFLTQFNLDNILEIGGLHGILAQNYLNVFPDTNWTIIEPNPCTPKNLNVNLIKGFFDEKFNSDKAYEAIVHSHVLEHIYDLEPFINQKSKVLKNGSMLIFSIPNMEEMLKRNYTNCLNFEHTCFITEPYIEHIFSKFKFKLEKKEYFKQDHSIFYAFKKNANTEEKKLPLDLYKKNKKIFLSFINSIKEQVSHLNKSLVDNNNSVYLFGAHIFSQYLINFGLEEKMISCILDNDKSKHGNRLYGTNLHCFCPTVLKGQKNPIVILKAGIYNKEIKKDILKNINPTAIFI